MTAQVLESYGLVRIGKVRVQGDEFIISLEEEKIVSQGRCIYAFLVDQEIMRIGSSRRPLRSRLREWERDVSRALKGVKGITPTHEATVWREVLSKVEFGIVYARVGTVTSSPLGEVNIYQTEESVLIARHQPRLCHDRKRHKVD